MSIWRSRLVWDDEEKQFGEVVSISANLRLTVEWEDGSKSRAIALEAFHVWDSGYSFI